MTTISNTLRINDAFSNTLSKFNSGVQRSVSMMGRLKGALNNGGFNSMNQGAHSATLGLKGLIAGSAFGGMISSATSLAANGIRSFAGELNEATVAWSTFEGNMRQLGKSPAQIAVAKKSMQKYAQQTIYSASDMASTYSQLAAVGTKNTGQLVKGFGGLAAAATDPKQAMKTLSEQATQMASKPMVQWQDFKLMLEQTPAGMAAVAKTMGMSTKQLVQNVQDGKIKTEDFLNAIAKTGTNANFTKMATQYKTVGQAMDGLKETLANKVQPQFAKLSQVGIQALSSLSDKLGSMDFSGFANNLLGTIKNVQKAWSDFTSGFSKGSAGSGLSSMFQSLQTSAGNLMKSLSGNNLSKAFQGLGKGTSDIIGNVAKGLGNLAQAVSQMNPGAIKLLGAAFIALKAGTKGLVLTAIVWGLQQIGKLDPGQIKALAIALNILAGAFMAFKAVKGIGKVFGSLKGALGKKTQTPAAPKTPEVPETGKATGGLLQMGGALVKIGTAAMMAGAGFALLGVGIKLIADSGSSATGILLGIGIAIIVVLGVVAALAGPLDTAAAGVLALGIAALLLGAGLLLASLGLTLLATQLPNIAQYGAMAALNILLLSVAIAVFGVAALIAMVGLAALAIGLILLAAGLIIAAVGAILFGAALLIVGIGSIVAAVGVMLLAVAIMLIAVFAIVASVGILLMGVGLILIAAVAMIAAVGLMLLAVALMLAAPMMMIAAVGALLLGVAAIILGAGLLIVAAALMLVSAGLMMVSVAVIMLVMAFITAGTMMVNAIVNAMRGVVNGVRNGVQSAVNAAKSFSHSLVSTGKQLIQGLINGISSMIGGAISAVGKVASAVVNKAKSILHIGSPSKLFKQYGRWVDQGLINGLNRDASSAAQASANMAQGVVNAASGMQPTLGSFNTTNLGAGDLLANGFNRAYGAINQVAGALNGLNGSSADIGIDEQTSADSSRDPLNLASAHFGGQSGSTHNDNSAHVTIEKGAIQLNSSGDATIDADRILDLLEQKMLSLANAHLGG